MSRRLPIVGHYGTEFEVDHAFKSSGPAVYLGWRNRRDDTDTFERFTPDKARDLAKRLTDAADEIEGRS